MARSPSAVLKGAKQSREVQRANKLKELKAEFKAANKEVERAIKAASKIDKQIKELEAKIEAKQVVKEVVEEPLERAVAAQQDGAGVGVVSGEGDATLLVA